MSFKVGARAPLQMVPVYQPSGFWDRILNAFNPATWARAVAGWVIEGVHGVICSVLQRVTGGSLEISLAPSDWGRSDTNRSPPRPVR